MPASTDHPYQFAQPAAPPPPAQPVRVDAAPGPDPRLSRWLWLVKWVLVIPHFIVLFFLWVAFAVLTVVTFFAILFTGRYPRPIFDFNVGVLRWTWRVQYYAYGGLATDRYPPFTLDDVPDYPAHLEITYPERLSRGLVLVKWWLLAIPHYLVLGLLLGWNRGSVNNGGSFWGLIPILVVVAAVVLLFSGRYPRHLYDLVIGLDRWVLRVAAYAALMTDTYPPFRLDQGGPEPSGTHTSPPSGPAEGDATGHAYPDLSTHTEAGTGQVGPWAGPAGGGTPTPPATASATDGATGVGTSGGTALEPRPDAPGARIPGWTAGRIVTVVVGAVLGLASLGLLAAGSTGLYVDHAVRDDGYVTTSTRSLQTPGYALTSEKVDLGPADVRAGWADVLGTVRVRAASNDPAKPVFVGIARTDDVTAYLDQVAYSVVRPDGSGTWRDHAGGPLARPPASTDIWVASVSGTGSQTLTWDARGGDWTLVLANENGSAGVAVRTDLGATIPDLGTWSAIALSVGGAALVGGVLLIVIPVVRLSRHRVTRA
ncbi:DUF4389 domain-containing protein [Pseudofrankia saprophytica]|uniref:DUF4389 domain-containing protein n=1 Tax=Pseudofrankia saprophytica TaxID=298655 RepID=UPI000234D2B4|nr:DUF4389 domain-containing protein [Pseudofrankia saprophytica]